MIADVVLLQSDVLFLGSPVELQHDLGPNIAATDVSSCMWVSTGRMETESSSGQGPYFCSSTLNSWYLPDYPMKNTTRQSQKHI